MNSQRYFLLVLILTVSVAGSAIAQQSANATQLDHFDLSAIDKSLDPCVDFYQYACKKWIDANPIPGDQPTWSHGSKLNLWNQGVLRDVLEKASADDPERDLVNQKIGDYYASCMDESAINSKGIAALKPELDRIDALKQKSQLPAEVAHLHAITAALAQATDSGAKTPLFGFGSSQDLDDASKVVAAADQGGLGLPDRDYYLKDDAKSAETRQQYIAFIRKTQELLGDSPAQAEAHAKVIMDTETALAKASMDI